MKYLVNRTLIQTEWVEIEANSEDEAIEIAKECEDRDWEDDQFSIFNDYEYEVEEIEE